MANTFGAKQLEVAHTLRTVAASIAPSTVAALLLPALPDRCTLHSTPPTFPYPQLLVPPHLLPPALQHYPAPTHLPLPALQHYPAPLASQSPPALHLHPLCCHCHHRRRSSFVLRPPGYHSIQSDRSNPSDLWWPPIAWCCSSCYACCCVAMALLRLVAAPLACTGSVWASVSCHVPAECSQSIGSLCRRRPLWCVALYAVPRAQFWVPPAVLLLLISPASVVAVKEALPAAAVVVVAATLASTVAVAICIAALAILFAAELILLVAYCQQLLLLYLLLPLPSFVRAQF